MSQNRLPSYRKHHSGQARVTINGQDHYLGPYGSSESYVRYDEVIANYLAERNPDGRQARTVSEVLSLFWLHCKKRYGGNGKGRFGNAVCYRPAIRILREQFGSTPVVEFGPKKLKRVIEAMDAAGWSRKNLTDNVNKTRLIFSWDVSEELVDPRVPMALQHVKVPPNMGLSLATTSSGDSTTIPDVGSFRSCSPSSTAETHRR